MIDFSNLNDSYLFYIIPGILFLVSSVILWSILSNYLLRKIDNENISFKVIINELNDLTLESVSKSLSPLFLFLILRLIIILSSIFYLITNLKSTERNLFYLIVLLFLSFIVNFIYNNEKKNFQYILNEFVLILAVFLWILLSNEFGVHNFLTEPFSIINSTLNLQLILFLILLLSMGKINTYLDYNEIVLFQSKLLDFNNQMYTTFNENPYEKFIRWITDSLNQIFYGILITFVLLSQISPFNGVHPNWFYISIFILLFGFTLISSLFLTLITNKSKSYEIDTEIKMKIIILFLIIAALII